MNAIELRDYYRSRRSAHELLAAQAGESYISKIHLDLAARYASLVGDDAGDEPAAPDERHSDHAEPRHREDSILIA